MKNKSFLVAVACVAAASWAGSALADTDESKFPKPGDTVTKANMAQAKDVLTPTSEWMLNQGMVMKVGPYRRYEWPKAYKDATEKYSGQVKLSAAGNGPAVGRICRIYGKSHIGFKLTLQALLKVAGGGVLSFASGKRGSIDAESHLYGRLVDLNDWQWLRVVDVSNSFSN